MTSSTWPAARPRRRRPRRRRSSPRADPDGAGIVAATLRLETPRGGERLVGAVPLLEDRYRSAVNAVLDATNRRLGFLAGTEPFVVPEVEDRQEGMDRDRSAAARP